jgi:hypothetical protein
MSLPVNNLSPGLSSSQSLSTRLMQTLGVKIPGSESYQNEQQIIGEYIDLVTGQEPNMKKPLRQWIQRVLSLSQGGVDEKEVQQLLDSERLKMPFSF